MKNYVGRLWGIVGIGLLTIPVVLPAGASDKPVTGDTVVREAQEAVTATKDYTIQQKDAFQRKVQTELDEMQVRIRQLRGDVKHASGEARAEIQKAMDGSLVPVENPDKIKTVVTAGAAIQGLLTAAAVYKDLFSFSGGNPGRLRKKG